MGPHSSSLPCTSLFQSCIRLLCHSHVVYIKKSACLPRILRKSLTLRLGTRMSLPAFSLTSSYKSSLTYREQSEKTTLKVIIKSIFPHQKNKVYDQHMYFDFTSPCKEQSQKKQTFQTWNRGMYGKYYVYNSKHRIYRMTQKNGNF